MKREARGDGKPPHRVRARSGECSSWEAGGRTTAERLNIAREEVRRLEEQLKQEGGWEDKDTRKGRGLEGAGGCIESLWDPRVVFPALGSFPIGHIRTCFPKKNGCPRQGSVCPSSTAYIDLLFGNNPHHAVDGLTAFSHVWLLFLFDLNGTNYTPRPRVAPPRLNGANMGVFATRSPHRPNPIGLSLVRLEAVDGRRVTLSGVDLVDGTPILDIKPYIPCYDAPVCLRRQGCAGEQHARECIRYPSWSIPNSSESTTIAVEFSEGALKDLSRMEHTDQSLRMMNWREAKEAIVQVVQADPRSVYRKTKCAGEVYAFRLDDLDVTCNFNDDTRTAHVVAITHTRHLSSLGAPPTFERAFAAQGHTCPSDPEEESGPVRGKDAVADISMDSGGGEEHAGDAAQRNDAVRAWGVVWERGVKHARDVSLGAL